MDIRVKRLKKSAKLPTPSRENRSRLDVYAHIDQLQVIKPFESRAIPTGLALEVPAGYELVVKPRLSFFQQRVFVWQTPEKMGGESEDELYLVLINLSHRSVAIHPGSPIAHITLQPVIPITLVEVEKERQK